MSANSGNWKSDNGGQRNNNYKGGGHGKNTQSVTLPEGYLKGGYYSDPAKEKLRPEYIVKYPREIANDFWIEGGKSRNKRSQIRKYYEYLLQVEKKMESLNNDYSMVEAYLLELIPKVTYANDRGVVTKIFEQFIENNVEAVKDDKDLRAFVKHFEAVIAFTKKDR